MTDDTPEFLQRLEAAIRDQEARVQALLIEGRIAKAAHDAQVAEGWQTVHLLEKLRAALADQ